MNAGILGGTFDPIHNGHLAIAEAARSKLKMEKVYVVPAGHPWQKQEQKVTPAEHRMAMVRLAIADLPYMRLATLEVRRPGPTYTVDTILELRERLGGDTILYFILGWDSLLRLPEWHDAGRLVRICYLVAAPRPGFRQPDLNVLEDKVPSISGRTVLLDGPMVAVSATEIRRRVARGLSVRDLVPEKVDSYIKQHGLYQA